MNMMIEEVSKQYGAQEALRGITLSLEQGMFGLLGPNGAGKTTLLRILATLLRPTSGRVVIGDFDLGRRAARKAVRAHLGYLPQELGLYPDLTSRELLDYIGLLKDALLTSPVIEHPVHLSLAPGFQRAWGSVYDALNTGTMPLPRLEHLVAEQPLETSTAWYAVDASVWPRCDAETSPDRGYYHHHSRHSNGQPIVAGWNYSWLVQLPERCSSWTAPLRVRRIQLGENVNYVAAEQIRSFLHQRGSGQPRPTFTFDAGYDPVKLGIALARLDVGARVRLRSGRCFYADPPQGPTGGRPRRHGAKFVCDDPTTWPKPTDEWSTTDTAYGRVRIQCWSGLHAIPQNHEKKEPGKLALSCAGGLSAWRWSACLNPPKFPCRSGSGGGDRSRQIWRPSGVSIPRDAQRDW
jgi:hypothetical protein